MDTFHLLDHDRVVFFTGAGISAESGVPTYRGSGGIWSQYRWQEVACEAAFRIDPDAVLRFHEKRRALVAACPPNPAHCHIASWQQRHAGITVITQNTDGLHQRAGSTDVIELHGSLWRLRCREHGPMADVSSDGAYRQTQCPACNARLRPDITWFDDAVDVAVFHAASQAIAAADLFVAVGTSAAVWPAAGLIDEAAHRGISTVEINPQETGASAAFGSHLRGLASVMVPRCFPLDNS